MTDEEYARWVDLWSIYGDIYIKVYHLQSHCPSRSLIESRLSNGWSIEILSCAIDTLYKMLYGIYTCPYQSPSIDPK